MDMMISVKGKQISLNEIEAYNVYRQLRNKYEKADVEEFLDQYCEDHEKPNGSLDKYKTEILAKYRSLYNSDDHQNCMIEEAFMMIVPFADR